MKFNLTYLGPSHLFECRGDIFMPLALSLQELGHHVDISHQLVQHNAINVIFGAYFLGSEEQLQLLNSGTRYINFNTEILADDGLNHNPGKTDLFGAYLPFMQGGIATWDALDSNIHWLRSKSSQEKEKIAKFSWGYLPSLDYIQQSIDPCYDAYIYSLMSGRRKAFIQRLLEKGLKLKINQYCPQFLRDFAIQNSKCVLQINQDDKYNHFAPTRTWLSSNNGIPSIVEKAHDPDDYIGLAYGSFSDAEQCIELVTYLSKNTKTRIEEKDKAREKLKSRPWMKDIVARVLDESL